MNTPILSDIFQRALSLELNTQRDNVKQQKTAYALWAEMADSLEVIAANTQSGRVGGGASPAVRTVHPAAGKATSSAGGSGHAGPSAAPKQTVSPSGSGSVSGKSSSGTAATAQPSSSSATSVKRKTKPAGGSHGGDGASTQQKPRHDTGAGTGKKTSSKKADTAAAKPAARKPAPTAAARGKSQQGSLADALKQAGDKQAAATGSAVAAQEEKGRQKTKSAEALQNIQNQKREDKRQNGFFSRLKDAFSEGKDGRTGDVVDAAGMAVGGPVWAVAKELKQAGQSLVGKDSFIGKFWQGLKGDKNDPQKAGKAGKTADAKEGGQMRDEHGRFIKASERDRVRREKQQLEIEAEALEIDGKEVVRTQRRHKEMLRAVKGLKKSFLGDALKGLLGRKGPSVSVGRRAKVRPDIDVNKNKKEKGKVRGGVTVDANGKDKDKKSRRLGGGGNLGGGSIPARDKDARGGRKKGGILGALGAGAKGAGRGLLGALKFLPGVGLAIAGIAGVVDAIDGWNDTDLHKKAFGLKDGEEATKGQKAAAAAASFLDLGGLTTGIANLLGFDVDVSDMARGLYNTVSAVADFFGQFDFSGVFSTVGGILSSGFSIASDAVSGIAEFASSLNLGERIQGLVSTVAEYGGKAVDFVVSAFSGISEMLSGLNLGERVQGIVTAVADFGGQAVDFVVNAFKSIPEMLSGLDLGEKVKGVVTAVSDTISSVFSTISDFISKLDIKGVIVGAIDTVTSVGGKVAEEGKSLFGKAKDWLLGDDKKEEKPAVPAHEATPAPKKEEKPAPAPEAPKTEEAPKPKEAPAVTFGGATPAPVPAAAPAVAPVAASVPASAPSVPVTPAAAPAAQPVAMPSFGETASPAPKAGQAPLVPAMTPNDRANMAGAVAASMPELTDLNDKTTQLVRLSEDELKLREKEYNLKLAEQNAQGVVPGQAAGGSTGPLITGGAGGSALGGGAAGSVDFSGAVPAAGVTSAGKIGDTVARFESGNAGVTDVSWDRTGGSSYGKWQLSAKQGSMQEYLDWMKKRGGKEAEIANSIQAAGPLENGKNGAAATEYKRQAAANGQLMEDTQRQFILEKQVNPALARLSPELQQRINGSSAMKEMFWSTIVQHGQGGGTSIFRDVYNRNRGASDEDLIKAIYADRGNHFGSSSAKTQAAVRSRFKEEVGVILGMYQDEKKNGGTPAANTPIIGSGTFVPTGSAAAGLGGGAGGGAIPSSIPAGTAGPLPVNAALEGQMSAGISNLTLDATNRHVSYQLGAKNSRNGSIDCSGWVYEQTSNLMNGINQAMGKEVFSSAAKKALKQGADNQGAAGIVQSVAQYTGKLYQGEELDPSRIGGGMVIGIDTGKHSWDGGRFQGIDHIAQTYKDPKTGQLMVSESSSSKGVHSQTYESWYNYYVKKRGARIFGGNVAAMANQGAVPQGAGAAAAPVAAADASMMAQAGAAPVMQGAPSPAAQPQPQPVAQAMPMPQPQPVQAQPVMQQPSPEPVGQIAPPTTAGTNNQLGTGNIEKLLKDILFVLRAGFGHMPLGTAGIGGGPQGVQGSSGQQPPNIQMDFDDPAAQKLATA